MEVIVVYDYTAEEPDELTINKGDIIKEVAQFEDGWYIGKLDGKVGVFPDNFVKKLNPVQQRESLTSSGNTAGLHGQKAGVPPRNEYESHQDVSSNKPPKRVVGIGLGNIFSGQPIQLRQAALRDVLKEQTNSGVNEGIPITPVTAPMASIPTSPPETEKVIVRFDYDPCEPDELQLRVDDIIVVMDRNIADEGWWIGHNLRTNKTGVFPDNFIAPVNSERLSQSAASSNDNKVVFPNSTVSTVVNPTTQVGIISAPAINQTSTAPLLSGDSKNPSVENNTKVTGFGAQTCKAAAVNATAKAPQPPASSSTVLPAAELPTTASSVATTAAMFGERTGHNKSLPPGTGLTNGFPKSWKARQAYAGPPAAASKDGPQLASSKSGNEDYANLEEVANTTTVNSQSSTTCYAMNRPRQIGKRLPKTVVEITGQTSTTNTGTPSTSGKSELTCRPHSVSNAAQMHQPNVSKHCDTQSFATSPPSSRGNVVSKAPDSPNRMSLPSSVDAAKSGGSSELSHQSDTASVSTNKQLPTPDQRRQQIDDALLQQKVEQLTIMHQQHVHDVNQQLQELHKQLSQVNVTSVQLRSDVKQTQHRLTSRLQALMDEVDEAKKQRASDAIELARLRTLFMQLDAKLLVGRNGPNSNTSDEREHHHQPVGDYSEASELQSRYEHNTDERENREQQKVHQEGGSSERDYLQSSMKTSLNEVANDSTSRYTVKEFQPIPRSGGLRTAPALQPRPVSLPKPSHD